MSTPISQTPTRKRSVVLACYDADLGRRGHRAFVGTVRHRVTRLLKKPTRVRTTLTRNLKSWIVVK